MPRRPRVLLNGVPLHIVQRGHNRAPCFFAEEDYQNYLHWLGEALVKESAQLHAYALMTNHVHLLITPTDATSISRIVMSLGRRYVQYINRAYRRTGTLWDSRYKSSLVDADTYLLSCMRYIEMNPVRAAMVDDPAHYRWTSYRTNALGQTDEMITPHPLYLGIARTDTERHSSYRALFRAGLDDDAISDIRLALNQSQPLGSSRFAAMIEEAVGERHEARPRGRPRKPEEIGARRLK
jgi:putative transposase